MVIFLIIVMLIGSCLDYFVSKGFYYCKLGGYLEI